ncbi:MAG: enolase C-terminal domain-like protein [Kiloniellales bacterium]
MTHPVRLSTFPVAFRWRFSHASASRSRAENVILALGAGQDAGYGEACPRTYVTGETLESVTAFLREHADGLSAGLQSLDDLRTFCEDQRALIDANPAAFGALDMALLDRLGRMRGQPLERLLGGTRRCGPFRYSAVIGAGGLAGFLAQALAYRAAGLFDVKMKLGRDAALNLAKAKWLHRLFGRPLRLRVDANNLWCDPHDCIEQLGPLCRYIWAVEEPLRAGDLVGCRRIASALDIKIILDESCCRLGQLEGLARDPETWVINLRVSKMGGILRSLEIAEAAAQHDIPVVIGAHVGETSLLTRAALAVAACCRVPPLAMEGAFGTRLLQADLVADPIMFARGGRLSPDMQSWWQKPGNGISLLQQGLRPL